MTGMNRFLSIILVFVAGTIAMNGQAMFSVSPGLISGGTAVGYKFGDIVPSLGFQYLSGSFSYQTTRFRYNANGAKESYTDKQEGSASVYMPQIGAKYFIKDMKDIKLYLNGNVNYVMVSASSTDNGVDNQDVKDAFGNNTILGFEFGVGSEYFFTKNFSIGGEFNLRYIFASMKDSRATTIFNPNTGANESSTVSYNTSVTMGITYSKLTLNYYFGE
jgi:opacity protein-like surface antigen